jgi:hypothetical protein
MGLLRDHHSAFNCWAAISAYWNPSGAVKTLHNATTVGVITALAWRLDTALWDLKCKTGLRYML